MLNISISFTKISFLVMVYKYISIDRLNHVLFRRNPKIRLFLILGVWMTSFNIKVFLDVDFIATSPILATLMVLAIPNNTFIFNILVCMEVDMTREVGVYPSTIRSTKHSNKFLIDQVNLYIRDNTRFQTALTFLKWSSFPQLKEKKNPTPFLWDGGWCLAIRAIGTLEGLLFLILFTTLQFWYFDGLPNRFRTASTFCCCLKQPRLFLFDLVSKIFL